MADETKSTNQASLEVNVRTALEKLAQALADASKLTVETYYTQIATGGQTLASGNKQLAASTVIQLDGDQEVIVPVTGATASGVIVEDSLLDFHLRNVQAAIEYRTAVLNTLVGVARKRGL